MAMPPNEKKLEPASFAAHASRGLIRDVGMRRKAMLALLFVAVVMSIAGSTVLRGMLSPREHVIAFFVFWIACGWFTLTALLLALYDLLAVGAQGRAERRALREKVKRA